MRPPVSDSNRVSRPFRGYIFHGISIRGRREGIRQLGQPSLWNPSEMPARNRSDDQPDGAEPVLGELRRRDHRPATPLEATPLPDDRQARVRMLGPPGGRCGLLSSSGRSRVGVRYWSALAPGRRPVTPVRPGPATPPDQPPAGRRAHQHRLAGLEGVDRSGRNGGTLGVELVGWRRSSRSSMGPAGRHGVLSTSRRRGRPRTHRPAAAPPP
jgi:hypothetical protein